VCEETPDSNLGLEEICRFPGETVSETVSSLEYFGEIDGKSQIPVLCGLQELLTVYRPPPDFLMMDWLDGWRIG
jgi:hypothetical protein